MFFAGAALVVAVAGCVYEPAPYYAAPAPYYAPAPAYYGYGPSVSLGYYGGGRHRHWR
jgi:hypothetical protein